MQKTVAWVGLTFLISVVGCGDDDEGGGGSSASGGAGTGAAGTSAASSGGSSTGGAGASSQGGSGGSGAAGASGGAGGACFDPGPLEYDVGPGGMTDCLTFAGASSLCGFSSDDSICDFAVACGASPDLGQCKVNCEMGVTVVCNTAMDVDCLVAAMCDDDCSAIAACGFIL